MTADQDVFNGLNGIDRPEARSARFYNSNLFGLNKDYAFPEGSNATPSRLDSITSVDKLWTRARRMSDGNFYDAHDALFTILKAVLQANPHINDDEPNSVNYKKPTT